MSANLRKSRSNVVKDALSYLRQQFLAAESLLEMMKNAF